MKDDINKIVLAILTLFTILLGVMAYNWNKPMVLFLYIPLFVLWIGWLIKIHSDYE